ncbi:MAG TPA: D-alanine--D-alanine ligase family protein [Silvibacterium sp.]|nr:D-alanine--D-alanine ligase family protein [Silvibacterium sp.]
MTKLRVGVLFGGRSGEHEISLLSAASVLKAIDRKKYEVTPIGITKEGRWVTASDAARLLAGEVASAPRALRAGDPAATMSAAVLARGASVIVPPVPSESKTGALVPFETDATTLDIQASAASGPALSLDVIFPVLHGTFGEDGTIQGLFELAGIAYVGSGVLGSATGMDKDVMKRLFAAAKLPIPKHVSFLRAEWEANARKTIAKIEAALKYPLFVKPANLGSSVGITKAHDRKELGPAINLAASYDRKIVVEGGVGGRRGKARELEVAVLGNDNPESSVVGEVVPGKEFYDYEAKYLSEGSDLIIPAKLTKAQTKQVQQMAIAAFRACDCSGLARVDFLMEPTLNSGKAARIYLNEINTLPGFTSISMYPKLWAASGVEYPELIDRLISLALERRAEKDRTSYSR